MQLSKLTKLFLVVVFLGACSASDKKEAATTYDRPKSLVRLLRRYDVLREGVTVDRVEDALIQLKGVDPEFIQKFTIHVIAAKEPQAYAFMSYDIVVTEGLVHLASKPEELATIILHEMAHIKFSHTAENRYVSYAASAISLAEEFTFQVTPFFLYFIMRPYVNKLNFISESVHYLNSTALNKHQEIQADQWAIEQCELRKISNEHLPNVIKKISHSFSSYHQSDSFEKILVQERLREISDER